MRHAAVAIVLLTLAFAGAAPAADKELNLLAWSEYIPQEVIDGFARETGVKVNYEAYASNEEMMSKLLAGGTAYDLIQPSEYMIEALAKKGKLQKLDRAKIPNLKNIGESFRNLPHDPKDEYSVPWMTGTVGIVVNSERVTEEIRGYRDVFQPKYKDRIIVLNDNREIVSWALNTLGLPINDMNDAALASAKPVVAEWVKLIRVYDSDSPKTALLNGDVDIGIVWSGEAALCWNENKKFRYVLPGEGAHQFVDSLAIPATAAHPEAATAFMNYILKPEVSKLISDKFPYTNPNTEAQKLLSKEQLENPASYPLGQSRLELFRDIGPAAAKVDEMVTELKAGG